MADGFSRRCFPRIVALCPRLRVGRYIERRRTSYDAIRNFQNFHSRNDFPALNRPPARPPETAL
jgi:hypothetical protein